MSTSTAFNLKSLKQAVVEAAIASDNAGFENVTDSKSLIKAVKTKWPADKNDARTYAYWLGLATYFGIDNSEWKEARANKKQLVEGPKLKELKTLVLTHYQCINSKALKQKLDEWQVPYGNLRCKASWLKLWEEVQPHYQDQAA
jgi:hypothetical protein